ncbi:hypothetical protein AA103196_1379 [Ameyamaea chiangmaiensis NBRC 103196]|uniref:NAD(P)-binding protein n=1 Tax=Ameyamaea chiangmaiensis TaxID=442969 RepID=UPI0021568198|nr:NAD(P)/FAD-dependent oxidoreductase [Ameyamaea chiangmaiensis]GBQ66384.1 hypothetical protein AA103196_1379 [Ameyamaea chiangmaiensis NBRC 103196]
MQRRDFINGVSAATLASLLAGERPRSAHAAQTSYPPTAQGLRGQYPGSFEIAHAARDGAFTGPVAAQDTGEHYDLVVVGGGISGLSAAWFYRQALGPKTRILIIDNHDDFGGHAKRNEFHVGNRMLLSYGGTMSIETPFPYSFTAKALLSELGIDLSRKSRIEQPTRFAGMTRGVFFDKAHFGADRIVAGYSEAATDTFWQQTPLDDAARRALVKLHARDANPLPDMTPEARRALLERISYETFLRQYARLPDQAVAFFAGAAYRNNMRLDTCPAFSALRYGAPGFAGMAVAQDPIVESETFHFPDGNASIARLLAGRLVPGLFGTPQTMESIVTARADYGTLDRASSPVRIRLGQMVVRVEHTGSAPAADKATGRIAPVRVVYQKPDGSDPVRHAVTADNVILACFNNIIPYIMPELPDAQKAALKYPSKVPMMYASVVLSNWRAWKQAGIENLMVPNGYYQHLLLDSPARFAAFDTVRSPDEPITLHMLRNPNFPGHPRKEQNRMGRAEMLATSFKTIEAATCDQLQQIFGPYGFDSARDILGLTVNRWPHGYAYTYDTLGDPAFPDAEQPHIIGRRPYGRVSIANADAGASAFTNVAIDQAERAVQDALVSRAYD